MARIREGAARPAVSEAAEKSKRSRAASREEEPGDVVAGMIARGKTSTAGAAAFRSEPLQDALAARALVAALEGHKAELRRRGLFSAQLAAALQLADRIEHLLQGVAGAALDARGRAADAAELLADAAASAHAVREAVSRVTRGPDGRAAARAFGLGEAFNARRPSHVLRALRRILEAAELHPEVVADLGLLEEDKTALRELEKELARAPGADKSGESEELHEAHAALRAFFDLVAAKLSLALSGDPEERGRLWSLIPRANERRHTRRAE